MSIAIRVSDPPELRERVPFDSLAGWPAPAPEMQRFRRGRAAVRHGQPSRCLLRGASGALRLGERPAPAARRAGGFDEYEADRRTHPTLASFMPRVVAYFDSLPDRLPAMQRRYDAMRPRIVSLSIENASDTVDPALREIVVRFDRLVSDDGWSVVPALGSSGPVPGAQERFPKIAWKALGHGFRSPPDGVPLSPYRIRFQTRGTAGLQR